MKKLFIIFILLMLLTICLESLEISKKEIENKQNKITELRDSLKISNEKRNRLYQVLMYKDIKSRQDEVDSLIYLIGLDN